MGRQGNYKRSIGTSPFQLVYGIDAVFLVQLSFPVIKFLQDVEEEQDGMKRRMFRIINLQHEREAIIEKGEAYKKKVNEFFDRTRSFGRLGWGNMLMFGYGKGGECVREVSKSMDF